MPPASVNRRSRIRKTASRGSTAGTPTMPVTDPANPPDRLGWSLLRAGFTRRLLAALLPCALLWAGVFWAVS